MCSRCARGLNRITLDIFPATLGVSEKSVRESPANYFKRDGIYLQLIETNRVSDPDHSDMQKKKQSTAKSPHSSSTSQARNKDEQRIMLRPQQLADAPLRVVCNCCEQKTDATLERLENMDGTSFNAMAWRKGMMVAAGQPAPYTEQDVASFFEENSLFNSN
ncbi:unnamed protein product [Agarophyton chilense]